MERPVARSEGQERAVESPDDVVIRQLAAGLCDRKERLGMERSPEFWRLFHRGCAAAMGLALLWVVVGSFAHVARATLIGEWVCAIAFGASWFWKGFELDALRGHPAQEVAPVGNGGGTGAT